MGKIVTIKEASEILGVTIKTLKIWDNEGKLESLYKTSGGHRRYDEEQLKTYISKKSAATINKNPQNKTFIYGRVSTKKQSDAGNLDRQIARLLDYAEDNSLEVVKIYKEIASGINENRKQLINLLSNLDKVDNVLVEYPDRLARFGLNYIKLHCKNNGVNIIYIEEKENSSMNEDLVNDLISIVTCFSARLYGARGGKKIKKEFQKTLNNT